MSGKHVRVVPAALVVLFLASTTAQQIPYWKGNSTTIKVCTSEYTPMVFCQDRSPEEYAGYEIELFRKVAAEIGWEPSMLEWSCLDWDEMLQHLRDNDGVCDIAVAGIDVNSKEADAGIEYTWPTFRNGFKILTSVQQPVSYGMWAFLDAFEWQVWLITAITILVVPFIVWAIDRIAYPTIPEGVEPEDVKVSTYFWQAVARPMWMRNQVAISWAGNIVVLIYAFLILILFALYIGYATANLTTTYLDSQITGVADLPGKAVGTWTDYASKLQKYGVAPVTYPWDTAEDEEAMIAALKNGNVQALVLDASFVDYVAAGDCDLVVVGSMYEQYEQATAFPKGFDNLELMDAYNAALSNITAAGVLATLEEEQLLPTDGACEAGEGSTSTAITFHQVAGLWIVLAVTVGIGLVLVLFHIAHVRYMKPVLAKSATLKKMATRVNTLKRSNTATASQTVI